MEATTSGLGLYCLPIMENQMEKNELGEYRDLRT